MPSTQATKKNLEKEFQALIKSANNLVNTATFALDETSSGVRSFAGDVQDLSQRMRGETMDLIREQYDMLGERVSTGVRRAGTVVRDHPYMAIGATFALGMAVSLFLRRK